MSLSPQSLARTRFKRSSRVPARYEAFTEIPPQYSYRTKPSAEPPTKSVAIPSTESQTKSVSKTSIEPQTKSVSKTSIEPQTKSVSKPSTEIQTKSAVKPPIEHPAKSVTIPSIEPQIKSVTISLIEPQAKSITISSTELQTKSVSIPSTEPQAKSAAKPSNEPQTKSAAKPPPKKKSKGISLMLKSGVKSNSVNNASNRTRPLYYQDNRMQSMPNLQYVARLLVNERVYLPTSVPNIAPMTLNTPSFAIKARKFPFVSRMHEACLAFQAQHNIKAMKSFYSALIKICHSMELRDLLNLSLANKTWRSVVLSECAWYKILVSQTRIKDWQAIMDHILKKFKTRELTLENQLPNIEAFSMANQISSGQSSLTRLCIKTLNAEQNQYFLEMLSFLFGQNQSKPLEIVWKIRIVIDEFGIAYVPLVKPPEIRDLDPMELPFCYMSHPEWMEPDESFLVDIAEINELFKPDRACPMEPVIQIVLI